MASTLDQYIYKLRCIEHDIRAYFDMKAIEHQMEYLSIQHTERASFEDEPITDTYRSKWKSTHRKATTERIPDLREVLCKRRAERQRRRSRMV